ncbi:PLP-dependent aminotransferase family protein [Nocardioides marmoriginsengisoli]|uniref:PLP-dependent aminotransferase family protein n=1 Tax=Nocardioides marmoriginsengisoli TaxID=661483 RepID=A0A3N0CPM5_9ACTN|nr:PLP-dependent aminotransferase family protein [Nocardioides marmoriginsengisoli]RNL65422.1 PLP-dependent aminotransferase family protein [Nocardioides marmoriginsengisoli]
MFTVPPVELDRDRDVPLAVQLADALRAAAANGQLRSGDQLPSTRALAVQLGVSRTVTAAAYEQLHAEGWIAGRRGSGTFVTTAPPGTRPGKPRRSRADAAARPLIDLTSGAPWAAGIDRAAWRRAWRAAADADPLPRPERAGLPAYREVVAEHLVRHRGLLVEADGVLATGGTTSAVLELAAAVLDRGATVAVEEPGYQRAVQVLKAAGMNVVRAPVDVDGLRVAEIPASVRAVFCSPAHQYPLGGRLPAGRRVELVERARREGWLVIEDDYDGELRYDVAPLPLLAALAPDVVVHLGTTSKILTPTLGTGWMVGSPAVTEAVRALRVRTATGPSVAGQRLLVELARHGDLGRHLRRLRRELSERRALIVDVLGSAGIAVRGDDAGAHVVVPLRSGRAEDEAVRRAESLGIRLDGLARHHAGRPRWYGLVLGYTACSRTELTAALPTLVELLSGRESGD